MTSTNGMTEASFASISEGVESLVEAGAESFQALKDRVADAGGETARELKHRLVDVKDVALDRGAKLVSSTTRMVKAHPIAAIGIALGIVLGAGLLAARSIRR